MTLIFYHEKAWELFDRQDKDGRTAMQYLQHVREDLKREKKLGAKASRGRDTESLIQIQDRITALDKIEKKIEEGKKLKKAIHG